MPDARHRLEATEPWRTIRNPIIGDEVTFLKMAAETAGEYVLARVTLAPGGGTPLHYHLTFAEEFEVVEGRLTVERDGLRLFLGPGERVAVPVGSRHRFANDTDRPVVFLSTDRPARRFEECLRVVYGLARDGRTNGAGVPKNPLQLALTYEMGESYLASVPLWLQRGIFGPLAGLARRLGVDRSFDRYLTPGSTQAKQPAEAVGAPPALGSGKLPRVSLLYLLTAATGAAVAIREDLPGEFAGRRSGRRASADFLRTGTALSPPLPMLAAQALFTVLSTRGGKAKTVGAAGLTALGAVATVGILGEPITYRVLSPDAFDPAKATLVSALIVLPSLTTVLGAKRLLATRSSR